METKENSFLKPNVKAEIEDTEMEIPLIHIKNENITIKTEPPLDIDCNTESKSTWNQVTSDNYSNSNLHLLNSSKLEPSNSPNSNKEESLEASNAKQKVVTRITTKRKLLRTVNAKCNVCGCLFSTKSNLARHFENIHPGIQLKNIEFKCKYCDLFFKSMEEVRRHSRIAHIQFYKPKPIYGRCAVCHHSSTTRCNLKAHFQVKHPDLEFDLEYKCGDCDRFFKTVEEFKEHSKTVHTVKKALQTGSPINIEGGSFSRNEFDELQQEIHKSESLNVISFSVFEIEGDLDIKAEIEDS